MILVDVFTPGREEPDGIPRLRNVASRRRARGIEDPAYGIRVTDKKLTFHLVRIAKEKTEPWAKIGNESIRRSRGDQAISRQFEALERCCLKTKVI